MSERKAAARAIAEFVAEQLATFQPVEIKHFFSGFSLNVVDGLQLGFVSSEGTLYFRILADDREEMAALGGTPFVHGRKENAKVSRSYYSVPARLLEDPAQLNDWADRAKEAAQISQAKKRKPARRTQTP